MEVPIFTTNKEFKKIIDYAGFAAKTDYTILLLGETGTGKGRLAEHIHKVSGRRGEFVEVNCGALTQTLVESELFGHKRGSFTGAIADHRGAFVEANDGTLFLDEVGELPLETQVKLLRVIQKKRVRPVGDEREKDVDVRLICATNRDIRKEVREGKFREDLYFRISTVTLSLPSLRERGVEDIKYYGEEMLREENRTGEDYGFKDKEITEDAWEELYNYRWPGNLRELRNVIRTAYLLANYYEKQIDKDLIIEALNEQNILSEDVLSKELINGINLRELLEDLEKEFIQKALFLSGYNQAKAAKYLGMSQQTFSNKIKKYGLWSKTNKE